MIWPRESIEIGNGSGPRTDPWGKPLELLSEQGLHRHTELLQNFVSTHLGVSLTEKALEAS